MQGPFGFVLTSAFALTQAKHVSGAVDDTQALIDGSAAARHL